MVAFTDFESWSPTRVDLAGGTLDLWPLYLFLGDCKTINVAINIGTKAKLRILNESKISLFSKDLQFQQSFSNLSELFHFGDKKLDLFKSIFRFLHPQSGFVLETDSESPIGGGLGASSSLVVSVLKVLTQACCKNWDTSQLIQIASNLEAQCLKTPTGTQDYVPALMGGCHMMNYSVQGMTIHPLSVDLKELEKNLLLVYTGRSHHSGLNNWSVMQNVVAGDQKTLKALEELREISDNVYKVIEKQKWDQLPPLLNQETSARKKLSAQFSSPEIDQLSELVLNHGADAVKICGAGGGGCVLVWVSAQKRRQVKEACVQNGFSPLSFNLVDQIDKGQYDG